MGLLPMPKLTPISHSNLTKWQTLQQQIQISNFNIQKANNTD